MQELKRSRGKELRQRHGAHAMGIGRKRAAGKRTDELALIFYVEHKTSGDPSVEPVPAEIAFTPRGSDEAVLLKTDVVESAPAVFE